MSGSRRSTRSTWCCPTRGTRSPASPPAWTWPRSGTATGGRSPISAGSRAASSTTAPRPSSDATSHPGWRCRCTRRRRRSPTTTGSPSTCLAAYRPTGKGRVERQVVDRPRPCGRRPARSTRSPSWTARSRAWLPIRRARSTAPTARSSPSAPKPDRAALTPLPDQPYLVTEKHLRRVGRDCLISFEASLLLGAGPPGPARAAGPAAGPPRPGGHGDRVVITASTVDGGGWLATHPRATRRGAWIVDPDHWAGLPDGHTRATIVEPVGPSGPSGRAEPGSPSQALEPLSALLTRRHADLTVAARPLTDYAHARRPRHAAGDTTPRRRHR